MTRLACQNAKQQHQRFSGLNSSDQIPSRRSREQSLPHTGSTRRASLHLWDTYSTLSPYSLEASASNCLLVSGQMQRPLFRLVWQLFETKGDTFCQSKLISLEEITSWDMWAVGRGGFCTLAMFLHSYPHGSSVTQRKVKHFARVN